MKHHLFTFGSNHLDGTGFNKYVEIIGDIDDLQARAIMIALFDVHWSMQYTEEEFLRDFIRDYDMTRHMLITVLSGS
jgi:hypothetical protein